MRISSEPLEWAGRLVTVYAVFKSPGGDASDPASWYTWDQQHAVGNLWWWGVLRDAGNISGSKRWSLDCHGPDAMMKRTLGVRAPSKWMPIFAPVQLEDEQNYVAITFGTVTPSHGQADDPPGFRTFDSSVFDHLFTGGNKAEMVAELNGWIQDALTGVDTNVAGSSGDFEDWNETGPITQTPKASVASDGFRISKKDVGTFQSIGYMGIAMHETRWRMMGFEPESQSMPDFLTNTDNTDATRVQFKKITAGQEYTGDWATGVDVPASGYWRAIFYTLKPGYTTENADSNFWDNNGGDRLYAPFHEGEVGPSEVFVLNKEGQQQIQLQNETAELLYLERQLTVGVSSLATIDATPTEHSRCFVLRGEIVTIDDDLGTEGVELAEAKKIYIPFRGSWVEGNHYGEVADTSLAAPGIYIETVFDPRAWGFDNDKLESSWAGKPTGRGKIELAALSTYHYNQTDSPYELAHLLVTQILVSTGSSDAWKGEKFEPGQPLPALFPGVNQPDDLDDAFGGDVEIADMGLGIPKQLVAPMSMFRAAFRYGDTWDETADFNRQRLAFIGPYESTDVLDGLTRPRACYWSLHGKQFGLFRMGPVSLEDVDMVITEDDLWG